MDFDYVSLGRGPAFKFASTRQAVARFTKVELPRARAPKGSLIKKMAELTPARVRWPAALLERRMAAWGLLTGEAPDAGLGLLKPKVLVRATRVSVGWSSLQPAKTDAAGGVCCSRQLERSSRVSRGTAEVVRTREFQAAWAQRQVWWEAVRRRERSRGAQGGGGYRNR